MFGDAIKCTHNGTGGSSTLTLAAVTGSPQPSDSWGTSGTMIVYYQIAEWTDSTYATLSKYEKGIGSLVLSTGVLTRSVVMETWTSGGSYNKTSASALSFGATAANVRVLLGVSDMTTIGALPIVQNSAGSGFSGASLGFQSINTRCQANGNDGTKTLSNGDRIWIPVEFRGGLFNNVAVKVTTLHAAAALRVGFYDWDTDGLAGNLITEFTSSSQIALTSTGLQSVAVATKIRPPPGWYYVCIQSNDSVATIAVFDHNGASGLGISTGERENMYYTKGATYGALPTTGDKTTSGITTKSAGGQPFVGFN